MSSVQTEFKDPVAGIKAIANAFVELVYQSGPGTRVAALDRCRSFVISERTWT